MTDLQQKLAVVISRQNIAWPDCQQIADAILARFDVLEPLAKGQPRYSPDWPFVVDNHTGERVLRLMGEPGRTPLPKSLMDVVSWLNSEEEGTYRDATHK